MYKYLLDKLQNYFESVGHTRSSIAFNGLFRDIKRATIFNLIPPESEPDKGGFYQVYALRLKEYLNISDEELMKILPKNREPWKYATPSKERLEQEEDYLEQWSGYKGYIDMEEAKRFVNELKIKYSNFT